MSRSSGLDPINAEALKETILQLTPRKGLRSSLVRISWLARSSWVRRWYALSRVAKVLDGDDVASVRATHGGRGLALGFAVVPSAQVLDVLRDPALVASIDHSNRGAEVELARARTHRYCSPPPGRRCAAGTVRALVHPSLHQMLWRLSRCDGRSRVTPNRDWSLEEGAV